MAKFKVGDVVKITDKDLIEDYRFQENELVGTITKEYTNEAGQVLFRVEDESIVGFKNGFSFYEDEIRHATKLERCHWIARSICAGGRNEQV